MGNKKWKASLSFSDVQEKLPGYKEKEKSYKIVDINNYTKEKLIKDELFIYTITGLRKRKIEELLNICK